MSDAAWTMRVQRFRASNDVATMQRVIWRTRRCADDTLIRTDRRRKRRGDGCGLRSRRRTRRWLRCVIVLHLQHAAADLVFLDRFEQRLEIALAESVIALALDELEEDRPDRVGRENLQQHF